MPRHGTNPLPQEQAETTNDDPRRETPEPVFQFRGVWMPSELLEMLRTGTLTASDFVVYALIDAFTYKGSRGCFASNEYLARAAGVRPQQASRIITRLVENKLVERTGNVQNRVLRVIRDHKSGAGSIPGKDRALSRKNSQKSAYSILPRDRALSFPGITEEEKDKYKEKGKPRTETGSTAPLEEGEVCFSDDGIYFDTLKPLVNGATPPDNGQKAVSSSQTPTKPSKSKEGAVNAISGQGHTSRQKGGVPPLVSSGSNPPSEIALFPKTTTVHDKPPKCRVEPPDRELSDRIKKFVKARGWVLSIQKKMWVEAAAIMRRHFSTADISHEQILEMWGWYADNYKPDGTLPTIKNAKEFHRRWDWITGIRDKSDKNVHNLNVTLDPAVEPIVDALANLVWPGNSEQLVPGAIHLSIRAGKSFISALRKADLSETADMVRDQILKDLGDIQWEFEEWFRRVHKEVCEWPDWSGNMQTFVWKPDHKWFVARISKKVREWTGHSLDRKVWDEILSKTQQKGRP